MTLFIRNLMPSLHLRTRKSESRYNAAVLVSSRRMHETRRTILRKLLARLNTGTQ
jgi:hypothetical protein